MRARLPQRHTGRSLERQEEPQDCRGSCFSQVQLHC
jgi:hypothetical protein